MDSVHLLGSGSDIVREGAAEGQEKEGAGAGVGCGEVVDEGAAKGGIENGCDQVVGERGGGGEGLH
jgi:hypothetical protein